MTVHVVLEQHRLLVHKISRDVFQVYEVLPNGNVILECECDGSMQHDDDMVNGDGSPEDVLKEYEVWQPGMVIRDRTGKTRFCGRENNWKPFHGVPPREVEERVLASQPPWMPPVVNTRGLDRLELRRDPK